MYLRSKLRLVLFSGALLALLQASAFGRSAIYYSVGTNANDLKVPSSLAITNGIASFSAAQPNNVGIGDEITYTAADNIAAKCYISYRVSSTAFAVIDRIGGTPNPGTVTLNSIKRAFTSLDAAVNLPSRLPNAADPNHLGTANLTSPSEYVLNIVCYADGIDSRPVTVQGWTTSAADYIRILTPVRSSEAGTSQRHNGTFGNGYRIETASGDWGAVLRIENSYVKVEGLVLKNTGALNHHGIYLGIGKAGVSIEKCLITGCTRQAISVGGAGSQENPVRFINCVLANNKHLAAYVTGAINYVEFLNVSAINNTNGGLYVGTDATGGSIKFTNCYSQASWGNAYWDGTSGKVTMTKCASHDASGSEGLRNIAALTTSGAKFKNVTAGSEDLHLLDGSALIDKGDVLSTVFADDMDSRGRSAPWDIGASEYFAPLTNMWAQSGDDIYNINKGNVGIGTSTPQAKLEINGDVKAASLTAQTMTFGGREVGGMIMIPGHDAIGNGAPLFITAGEGLGAGTNGGSIYLTPGGSSCVGGMCGNGKVVVDKGLNVIGIAEAKSFKVGEWTIKAPDYVFEKDYKLMSLKEVENFIEKNKHLPGVPSAEQMTKDGVDLAQMNMDLLKKVEELTLYVIGQGKTIQEQQRQIEKLK